MTRSVCPGRRTAQLHCNPKPLGEDTSIMRTTILPSMLDVLSFNYNHKTEAAVS